MSRLLLISTSPLYEFAAASLSNFSLTFRFGSFSSHKCVIALSIPPDSVRYGCKSVCAAGISPPPYSLSLSFVATHAKVPRLCFTDPSEPTSYVYSLSWLYGLCFSDSSAGGVVLFPYCFMGDWW